jgi:hypothetical protein
VALLVAGLPFWLTGLEVRPDWANNRFTMPYMAGVSLFVAGAIGALANRRRVVEALLVVLVAAGTGLQVNNANLYRIDWAQQKELVWQMDWRIPALQPGTLVLINDQGGMANSPTYLSYVFNWIYAQDNHTNHLSLFPTYPQYILNKLNTSNGDAAIHTANEGADFTGSKKDVLSLYYTNKCLAILDPQVDIYNPLLTSEEKSMAALSNPSLIITDPAQHVRMPTNIFGSELPKDDCYWYQQADLARQAADWQGAARIGDDHLNMERVNYRTLWIPLPYIESYAHLNQWKRSADLTHQLVQLVAGQTGQKMDARPMLCSLWRRMAATTSDSPEKQSALQAVVPDLNCNIP